MTIQVNFSRPVPLFPLDQVALMPQQVLPLHIFEPRYRQMIDHVLDGAGQIAMGVFEGDRWKQEYHGRPLVRPAVCIGHVVQHEKLPDGRYNVLLQGVCRARIREELDPPEDPNERLYRMVRLDPVGLEADEEELYGYRYSLADLLGDEPLTDLAAAETIVEHVRNEAIPLVAVLELVSFTMVTNPELKYRLLEEGDATARADLIEDELRHVRDLLLRAQQQRIEDLPKGCHWN